MIRAENLSISYVPGENPALRSVSLCVEKAERVALIGANGAGKSTLLLALVGILPPAAGSASVCGLAVEKKNLRLLRQKAAFVFQNPDDQLFMPTVYEDIAFGPRNYGVSENLIKERAMMILEELGIAHLAGRLAGKLSGGEKRLAALAGVLVMEPEILLLDEPSSFLDPRARRRLIRILRGLGQTLIIATHDLDLAREVCGRTILLQEGRIAADAQTPRILRDARLLQECGL
ncbi:MAG: energy-coupling factor ABC transporter ATP-binding protein [Spirochaetaceae bacterium]|nr:energy-coupling factor ABC transporter ATP-binding protein [Spirochaetaceae bacterium]